MDFSLEASRCLPRDGGTLIGRAWIPGAVPGPGVVVVEEGGVFDITAACATTSELLNADDPLALVRAAPRDRRLGNVADILANSHCDARDPAKPYFLAPVDLQALKACGVTFVRSLLERVIEEQTRGDPGRAEEVRASLTERIGVDLSRVRPASPEAMELREILTREGRWSQYLEVGIGPDAEVFTKAQPMSAVGTGAEIGIHPASTWNNPEPEVVLAVAASGRIVGATLGNDVNLRDFEGRSALLLGKAKDNNGSCSLGPFIRLFDEGFGLDDVRACTVRLEVHGDDGFELAGESSMREISRDVEDLVAQAMGGVHQYPDGMMLFTGTMFAPIQDRDTPGHGFTHKLGDVVTISAAALGALVNRVNHSDRIPPWGFGMGALMRNLAARGLLKD